MQLQDIAYVTLFMREGGYLALSYSSFMTDQTRKPVIRFYVFVDISTYIEFALMVICLLTI